MMFSMRKTAIIAVLCFIAFIPLAHSQGKLVTVKDFKTEYGEKHNVEIWLPDEYYNGAEQNFPVLYMHDGQNLFDDNTAMGGISWQAGRTAYNLIKEDVVKPFIIVSIWSTPKRYFEFFPEKAAEYLSPADLEQIEKISKQAGLKSAEFLGDEYLKFITQDLKPYIDSEYRTKPEPENTSICGSSMGALISLYAICEYPEVFGNAACMSTHWPVVFDDNSPEAADAIKKYLEQYLPDPNTHTFYFDLGTQGLDQYYDDHQKTVDSMMKQKGYTKDGNWVTKVFPDAEHNEKAWGDRFNEVLLFLYKK